MFTALCRCHAPSAFALPTSSILDTSAAVRTRNVSGASYATASPLRTVSMLCCRCSQPIGWIKQSDLSDRKR